MNKIVACLDIVEGKVSKGKQFGQIQTLSDPIERGFFYQEKGIDELIYYDIKASIESRAIFLDQVKILGEKLKIPFTVGGGIRQIQDIEEVLAAGADKVSINSAAIDNINIIKEGSEKFGSEKIVAAIDVKKIGQSWKVFKAGGQVETDKDALEWAKELEENGAGEVCINSIDQDGMKNGFDLKLMEELKKTVQIPLIASGGAGSFEDFKKVFELGIEKALGASIFHYDLIDIVALKNYIQMDFSSLIPTIVQDFRSGEVLTLAYSNQDSFTKMLETKTTWFYSRSRETLWNKGEESGNFQKVKGIYLDCDYDTILVKVEPLGPACHTGEESCFFRKISSTDFESGILVKEYDLIQERKKNPQEGYTDYLFREGLDKILKKVGEEATETVIASKNSGRNELIYEISDLFYHLNVLMVEKEIKIEEVLQEISSRRKAKRK